MFIQCMDKHLGFSEWIIIEKDDFQMVNLFFQNVRDETTIGC